VRGYWPDDARFSADAFGFQPLWLIMQALEWGAKLRHEALHLGELGIAQLSCLYFNNNRDPKSQRIPESEFYRFAPPDPAKQIDADACNVYFDFLKEELLPIWVAGLVSGPTLKTLVSCKTSATLPKVRLWISDDVYLFCPRIKNGVVFAPLAMVQNTTLEEVVMTDFDTGAQIRLRLDSGESRCTLNEEFRILG
jgi:hypothetical protein